MEQWEIEGRATALLLLDLQVGHVEPSRGAGPALRERYPELAEYFYDRLHETALPAVLALQTFAREHRLPVVHAVSGLALPDGRELADWSWRTARLHEGDSAAIPRLFPPGDPDREVWRAIAPRPNELMLARQTLSPFNGTALDQYLHNMRVENLLVAGLLTNAAVETTARDAGDRGFNTIVVEDACAALSEEEHLDGTAYPAWYVVKSSREVMDQLTPLLEAHSHAALA